MKKTLLIVLGLIFVSTIFAQKEKGDFLLETNTLFGQGQHASTGLYFSTTDGLTMWNAGFDGGYFLLNNLALKAGIGYGSTNFKYHNNYDRTKLSYKLGVKYYLLGKIPLQVDINNISYYYDNKNANTNDWFLGIQAGYALFLNKTVSVEPNLRYDFNLNGYNNNYFNVNIGFVIHL